MNAQTFHFRASAIKEAAQSLRSHIDTRSWTPGLQGAFLKVEDGAVVGYSTDRHALLRRVIPHATLDVDGKFAATPTPLPATDGRYFLSDAALAWLYRYARSFRDNSMVRIEFVEQAAGATADLTVETVTLTVTNRYNDKDWVSGSFPASAGIKTVNFAALVDKARDAFWAHQTRGVPIDVNPLYLKQIHAATKESIVMASVPTGKDGARVLYWRTVGGSVEGVVSQRNESEVTRSWRDSLLNDVDSMEES